MLTMDLILNLDTRRSMSGFIFMLGDRGVLLFGGSVGN